MNTIWFDMDGTVYPLYDIPNWLEALRANDWSIYNRNRARANLDRIIAAIDALDAQGWRVGVLTWASKGIDWSNPELEKIGIYKQAWIDSHMPALSDSFFCMPYGFDKAELVIKYGEIRSDDGIHILVDDNKLVRESWRAHGKNFKTINASRSFYRALEGLLG